MGRPIRRPDFGLVQIAAPGRMQSSGRVAGTCAWLGATRSATPPPLWIAHWISTLLVLNALCCVRSKARRHYTLDYLFFFFLLSCLGILT